MNEKEIMEMKASLRDIKIILESLTENVILKEEDEERLNYAMVLLDRYI